MSRVAAGCGAAILGQLGCSTHRVSALPSDPARLDLREAAEAVRARSLSPVELTRACLERIERLDPQLNSFITVTAERALIQARDAEAEIAVGRWRGPLHGIPIALKDNVDTAGVRTTAASAVFRDRVPTEDADVVSRLKAAGAVFLGKLNMHEFAMGTTSAISHFGPVRNPWNPEHVAGGSSGGSAAAVAASLCFGAVGTDTGGSVRIPASCCGIVGLRPTLGVVSTRGVVPISSSFDTAGPMCRTVADAALMFRAMTGHRVSESYDPERPAPVSDLRVGVVPNLRNLCGNMPIEGAVQSAVDAAIGVIRTLVADVRDSELPMPGDLGRVIAAEGYAFHAPHLAQASELYDPRTRAIILGGEGISDAEAERLGERLARHRSMIQNSFSDVDLMVMPTLPREPLTIREATDPFALPACTIAFAIGGLPSISVPCGFSPSGLPIGLLIGGPALSEARVLALAQAYERVANWRPTDRLGEATSESRGAMNEQEARSNGEGAA